MGVPPPSRKTSFEFGSKNRSSRLILFSYSSRDHKRPLTRRSADMLPFLLLSLHSIAEKRGEGLHPKLLALLRSREEGVVANTSKKNASNNTSSMSAAGRTTGSEKP